MVQWLRHCASTAEGMGPILGGGTKIPYAQRCNKQKEGKIFGSVNGDPYGITEYLRDTKDEVAYFNTINIMCRIYPDNYTEKEEKWEEDEEDSDAACGEAQAEEKDE